MSITPVSANIEAEISGVIVRLPASNFLMMEAESPSRLAKSG